MKLLIPALFACLLGSCSTYQSSVHSRSLAGYTKNDRAGISYTVTYK